MVVKALVEWQGAAGSAMLLDIDLGVTRWGRTSFDVAFTGRWASGPCSRRPSRTSASARATKAHRAARTTSRLHLIVNRRSGFYRRDPVTSRPSC